MEILKLVPTPPGDHYVSVEAPGALPQQQEFPLTLVMCGGCGLAQLPDVVDPNILYGNYIYNTSISLGLAQHFDRYAQAVIERLSMPAGSFVVDVGSNDGTLLRGFKSRGMRVLGIDPAPNAAPIAARHGIETKSEFFDLALADQLRRDHGAASVVTANNVFANVDDLDAFVGGVRTLLADNGVFVFETGYFPDLVRQNIIDNIYHEHLSYYAVKPLQKLFPKHGMELIAVEHEPTKGGSIRGFVQVSGSTRQMPAGDLPRLVDEESQEKLDRPECLRGFTHRIEELRRRVIDEVGRLKAKSEPEERLLAGYGASVGVTTLLYYFDLGGALDFLVDDNPVRYGLLAPGHRNITVLPSDELYERQPKNVLLLAWRYAEPIMKRHAAYLEAGGRFIVPLPDIRYEPA